MCTTIRCCYGPLRSTMATPSRRATAPRIPHALVSIPIDSPTPGSETIRSTAQLRSGHLTALIPFAETPMWGGAVSPVLWP